MSFVTTQPEALSYAAGKLQTIGSGVTAESAAAAAPTTDVTPAAADEVSALQAAIFGAYGSLYQSVNAQAATIHELFVQTLGASAGSYSTTESANSGATASRLSSVMSSLLSPAASADPPGSDIANLINIGGGNWSAAASDLLDMAQGGILPGANEVGDTVSAADGTLTDAAAPVGSGGLGGAPILAGLGQAPSVGRMSLPPSWGAEGAPAPSTGALTPVDWTAPAPQSTPAATVPAGMPMVATSGKTAGLGTPRYGVKPTVMAQQVAG